MRYNNSYISIIIIIAKQGLFCNRRLLLFWKKVIIIKDERGEIFEETTKEK